ncbi:hypothetical protein [Nocardia puris]|uniref:Lipoprotein n=1 Tax=Nocardia puris TaxID=208602 RepID=A0A366DU72_9NOCA|nr:hypothetical protein [Nocardia puris]RBO92758.1 hypothetical protein DFR74_103403 [Nocardia puris]
MRKNRLLGPTCVFAGLLVAMASVVGCGGEQHGDDRRLETTPVESDIAREASEFGGIVIPEDATVLGARSEHGRDTLYRVAVSTDPEGLALLLASSKFTVPLTKVFRVAETTIAGPPLETSASLLQAEDVYQRPDGLSVNRIVVVDERDSSSRIVHIQLFDT